MVQGPVFVSICVWVNVPLGSAALDGTFESSCLCDSFRDTSKESKTAGELVEKTIRGLAGELLENPEETFGNLSGAFRERCGIVLVKFSIGRSKTDH